MDLDVLDVLRPDGGETTEGRCSNGRGAALQGRTPGNGWKKFGRSWLFHRFVSRLLLLGADACGSLRPAAALSPPSRPAPPDLARHSLYVGATMTLNAIPAATDMSIPHRRAPSKAGDSPTVAN